MSTCLEIIRLLSRGWSRCRSRRGHKNTVLWTAFHKFTTNIVIIIYVGETLIFIRVTIPLEELQVAGFLGVLKHVKIGYQVSSHFILFAT